jgi:iron complex transport system ATP-binding protein
MAARQAMTALLVLDRVRLQVAGRTLVDGLSLEICAGQRWAVLGPNGAGKSTLLAVLAGARPAEGGQVTTGGRALRTLDELELARLRALVADRWIDPFASSVIDTVLTARYSLPRDLNGSGAALASALLSELDCDGLAERDVRQLSRGERQRVAIATALAQDTPLVLLDEPTAHQDPRHQAWVVSYLATLRARALVASLHDINAAARFATHALLLSGQVSYVAGPVADVLNDAALSALFETRISSIAVDDGRYFRVHPAHR